MGVLTMRPAIEGVGEQDGPSVSSRARALRSPRCRRLLEEALRHEVAGRLFRAHREFGRMLLPHILTRSVEHLADDFKLACHADDEKTARKLLQGKTKLVDPALLKQFLGCNHRLHEGELAQEVRVPGGGLPVPE